MASAGNATLMQAAALQNPETYHVVLVCTQWNAEIVESLRSGALEVLNAAGIGRIDTLTVPGAVEIPFAIHTHYRSSQPAQAYIALACVIKGDTPHFDYVCQSITQGITLLNSQLEAPVIFGVLTVNTPQQAHERLGGIHGHKGQEAGHAALQMMALQQQLHPGPKP
ncbi:MAG: 6,7-dimethyl-8-ribityllumazine synthase [Bacteroidetes bacterium]|nr:MAG: 6,7-dimethyl-8-ribityllumazine synthase [Bacteroidota bacterium]